MTGGSCQLLKDLVACVGCSLKERTCTRVLEENVDLSAEILHALGQPKEVDQQRPSLNTSFGFVNELKGVREAQAATNDHVVRIGFECGYVGTELHCKMCWKLLVTGRTKHSA
jgi:hypothetical protein